MNTVVTPIGEGRRIRPLGGVERLFYLWSLAVPVHFCLVAQIEGAIDLAGLGAALEQVRRRYPALRVCILDDAETGPMFHETENTIEISTVPVKVQADWPTVVQSELNRAFEAFPGPLMRVTFLPTSDGASIVLTFHHAIADGLSAIRVLRDVMRALAGEPLDALRPLPPIDEMMISSASTPALAPEAAPRAEISSKAWERVVAQAPGKLTTNISTLEWSSEETIRLIERCRANDTTVHGAICAAAAHHLPASEGNVIRMFCPVDFTRIVGIKTGDCGNFIGPGTVELSASRRQLLWLNAREIVNSLRAVRSPSALKEALQRIAAVLPPTAGKDNMTEFFASRSPNSAVISNLGVLPLAVNFGPLTLKAVWGPAMSSKSAGLQTIGVSTFAGRLRMVRQSYQPILGLLEAIRATLLAAC
jgi:Condensation domain